VLSAVRSLLKYEMTIAEWIRLALLAGVPYLIVGVIWAITHTEQASFLGSIVSWPALLFSSVCMR
jgi:hypothetical protein